MVSYGSCSSCIPFDQRRRQVLCRACKDLTLLIKWHCSSPAVRWIPSAAWEQQENSKSTSHPKAEVAHCVFFEGKSVHRPLCLHTGVLRCLALKPSGELIGSRLESFACIRTAKSGPGSKTNQKPPVSCRTTKVPTRNHYCSCIREKEE